MPSPFSLALPTCSANAPVSSELKTMSVSSRSQMNTIGALHECTRDSQSRRRVAQHTTARSDTTPYFLGTGVWCRRTGTDGGGAVCGDRGTGSRASAVGCTTSHSDAASATTAARACESACERAFVRACAPRAREWVSARVWYTTPMHYIARITHCGATGRCSSWSSSGRRRRRRRRRRLQLRRALQCLGGEHGALSPQAHHLVQCRHTLAAVLTHQRDDRGQSGLQLARDGRQRLVVRTLHTRPCDTPPSQRRAAHNATRNLQPYLDAGVQKVQVWNALRCTDLPHHHRPLVDSQPHHRARSLALQRSPLSCVVAQYPLLRARSRLT
jgi:hypothetical protein